MPETISIPDLIRREAVAAKIPPELALAVAEQESNFDPTARNPQAVNGEHATGVFQFLPSTARSRGVDPDDPLQNIRGGVAYLRDLLDQHQDVEKALAAYGGVRTNTTYVPGVLARVKKYQARAQETPAQAVASPPPQPGTTMTTNAVGAPPPTAKGWISPTQGITESIGRAVIDTYNPFTPSGRRNIGGTVGGLAAGLLAAPSGPGAVVAATAGAGVGGGFAGAVNNLIEGTQDSTLAAAGEQAALELGGKVASRAIWAIPKRVVAGKVAKAAAAKVSAGADEAKAILTAGLDKASRLLTTRSRAVAGENVRRVVEGPAKSTLNQLGEAVEATAAAGPAIATAPIRARIQELAEQISPTPPTTLPKEIAFHGQTVSLDQLGPAMRQAIAALPPVPADHPLPGTLAKVQALLGDADTIPFQTAHTIKRLLDDAVEWNSPAKKLVQQASKGLRQTVREQLASHAPYNDATAAYGEVARLFGGKYGKAIRRLAQDEPGEIVGLIKPTDTRRVQQLRELLTDVAGEQGPRAEQLGQSAWDQVRAAWTAEKLIAGDPTKLGARLQRLSPDFVQEFYRSDPGGAAVLTNLQEIAASYQQAVAQGKLTETTFRASSIYQDRLAKALEGTEADVIRAVALGPGTFWGAYSIGRLLRGPASADLITWAAYSPERTQLLVRVMTGKEPGQALAQVIRMFRSELGEGQPPATRRPSGGAVGTPPPAPSR